MKNFLFLLLFASSFFSEVFCSDHPIGPLREVDVQRALRTQGLNEDFTNQIIALLKSNPLNDSEQSELRLSAALFSHGINGAFFVDNDNWNLDAVINYRDQLVRVGNLFDVHYYNGGLNIELVYKWLWIFIPENVDINYLDGAVFGGEILGRGLALTLPFNAIFNGHGRGLSVGIEGGWVYSETVGNVFIVAAKAGFSYESYATHFGRRMKRIEIPKKKLKPGISIEISKTHRYSGTGVIMNRLNITFPKLVFRQKKILPSQ